MYTVRTQKLILNVSFINYCSFLEIINKKTMSVSTQLPVI